MDIKNPPRGRGLRLYNLGLLLGFLIEGWRALFSPEQLPTYYEQRLQQQLETHYTPITVEGAGVSYWAEAGVSEAKQESLSQLLSEAGEWLSPLTVNEYQLVLAHNGLSSTLETLRPGYLDEDWPTTSLSGGFVHSGYNLLVVQDTVPTKMEAIFWHELGHLWFNSFKRTPAYAEFQAIHAQLTAESLGWADADYYLTHESEYFAELFARFHRREVTPVEASLAIRWIDPLLSLEWVY